MRHSKIADLPLAGVPVSLRPALATPVFDPTTRIVMAAMGIALVFLAFRIFGQF